MKKTALLFTSKYLNHETGIGHPESSARLRSIMHEINKSGLLKNRKCALVEPECASIKEVGLAHESEYIKLVQRVCSAGGGLLDLGDTVVSSESFEVALLAVGGATKAVDLVMSRKHGNAFALVRPPGHHAGPYYALGFCIFNNTSIAALHLIDRFKIDRVLILDVDAHHGNGTQEIFYETDKVLYISLHQDSWDFPGTGFIDEVGKGEGLGFTVNIPLPFRINDQIYLKAFHQIVIPIIQQFRPKFILVSTGFDNHHTDPVANLSLSALSYVEIFERVMELASDYCAGRLVAILEGGYSMKFLGRMATAVIARMAEASYFLRDEHVTISQKIRKKAERKLEEVMKVQSSFWDL